MSSYFTRRAPRKGLPSLNFTRVSSLRSKSSFNTSKWRDLDKLAPEGMADIEGSVGPKIDKGFFARLFTPKSEKCFIDGLKSIANRESKIAYKHFSQSTEIADGAFMAGYLALQYGDHKQASIYLRTAVLDAAYLGEYFAKYEVKLQLKLSICDDITIAISPDRRGATLCLVEVYQLLKYYHEAIKRLKALNQFYPGDNVILHSMLGILYECNPTNKDNLKQIIALSSSSDNTNFIACATFLYRAKALLGLGMPEGAREILTKALRLSKGCPTSLHCAFRYERAIVYEALNKPDRARTEREILFSEDPYYKDISQKLGL